MTLTDRFGKPYALDERGLPQAKPWPTVQVDLEEAIAATQPQDPFRSTAGAASPGDASSARRGARAIGQNDEGAADDRAALSSVPLALTAAFVVACEIEERVNGRKLTFEAFTRDAELVELSAVLTGCALGTVLQSAPLQMLRSTAVLVLDRAPELGQRMVEALAALDAQLNGQG